MYFYNFSEPFLFVFFLVQLKVYSLFLRFLVFSYCRMNCGVKKLARITSDVGQTQLVCLIYNLVSRIIALRMAFVMMVFSSQRLPASVSALLCTFIFEIQSKSSAKMFRVPWLFLHCWFSCV